MVGMGWVPTTWHIPFVMNVPPIIKEEKESGKQNGMEKARLLHAVFWEMPHKGGSLLPVDYAWKLMKIWSIFYSSSYLLAGRVYRVGSILHAHLFLFLFGGSEGLFFKGKGILLRLPGWFHDLPGLRHKGLFYSRVPLEEGLKEIGFAKDGGREKMDIRLRPFEGDFLAWVYTSLPGRKCNQLCSVSFPLSVSSTGHLA